MKRTKILKLLTINLTVLSLLSCSGSVSGRVAERSDKWFNQSGDNVRMIDNKHIYMPLTIADSGIVPQVDDAVRTYITVHNNSVHHISDIHYEAVFDKNKTTFTLDHSSINSCAEIQAGDTCRLYFDNQLPDSSGGNTTAQATNAEQHTSNNYAEVTLKATYTVNDNGHTSPNIGNPGTQSFSRKLKFAKIDKTNVSDLSLSDDLVVNSYGNQVGHAVMYLYNGVAKKLRVDKPGIEISEQPDITNGLHVIEITAPILNQSFIARVRPTDAKTTINGGGFYIAGANDKFIADTKAANLKDYSQSEALISISELYKSDHPIAIIGNAKDKKVRKITLNNNGNVAAKFLEHKIIDDTKADQPHLKLEENTCKEILPAYSSCEITVKLNQAFTDKTIKNPDASYQLKYASGSTELEPQQINYALNYMIYPKNFNFGLISEDKDIPIGDVLVSDGNQSSKGDEGFHHPDGTKDKPYVILGSGNGVFQPGSDRKKQRFRLVYKNFGEETITIEEASQATPKGFKLLTRPEDPTSCISNDRQNKIVLDPNVTCTYTYENQTAALQNKPGSEFLPKNGVHKFTLKLPTFKLATKDDEIELTPPRWWHSDEYDVENISVKTHYEVVGTNFKPNFTDVSNAPSSYSLGFNSIGFLNSTGYRHFNVRFTVPKIYADQIEILVGNNTCKKEQSDDLSFTLACKIIATSANYAVNLVLINIIQPRDQAFIAFYNALWLLQVKGLTSVCNMIPDSGWEEVIFVASDLFKKLTIGTKTNGALELLFKAENGIQHIMHNVVLNEKGSPVIDRSLPQVEFDTDLYIENIFKYTTNGQYYLVHNSSGYVNVCPQFMKNGRERCKILDEVRAPILHQNIVLSDPIYMNGPNPYNLFYLLEIDIDQADAVKFVLLKVKVPLNDYKQSTMQTIKTFDNRDSNNRNLLNSLISMQFPSIFTNQPLSFSFSGCEELDKFCHNIRTFTYDMIKNQLTEHTKEVDLFQRDVGGYQTRVNALGALNYLLVGDLINKFRLYQVINQNTYIKNKMLEENNNLILHKVFSDGFTNEKGPIGSWITASTNIADTASHIIHVDHDNFEQATPDIYTQKYKTHPFILANVPLPKKTKDSEEFYFPILRKKDPTVIQNCSTVNCHQSLTEINLTGITSALYIIDHAPGPNRPIDSSLSQVSLVKEITAQCKLQQNPGKCSFDLKEFYNNNIKYFCYPSAHNNPGLCKQESLLNKLKITFECKYPDGSTRENNAILDVLDNHKYMIRCSKSL